MDAKKILEDNSNAIEESFVYYLTKKYQDRDITVFYKSGDIRQLQRLRKQVRVKQYTGQKIECEKIFVNYSSDILDNYRYFHDHSKYHRLNRSLLPRFDTYLLVNYYSLYQF